MSLKKSPISGTNKKATKHYIESVLREDKRENLEKRLNDYIENQGWEQITPIISEDEVSTNKLNFSVTNTYLRLTGGRPMGERFCVAVRKEVPDGEGLNKLYKHGSNKVVTKTKRG